MPRLILAYLVLAYNFESAAFAQQDSLPPPPSFGELVVRMIPMLVMVFFVFYFLVLKPQQAKLKAQEDMVNSLKKGDKLLTSGGIIGRVAGIYEDYILVEVSNGVKIKVIKSKIEKKIEKKLGGSSDK